jgi:hypothetical protein
MIMCIKMKMKISGIGLFFTFTYETGIGALIEFL